jgi:Na+/H+ antiporter NhaD/arsenite permease-like protein
MANLPYDDSVKHETAQPSPAIPSQEAHREPRATSSRPVLLGLVAALGLYSAALFLGYPQAGRDAIVAAKQHDEHQSSVAADHADEPPAEEAADHDHEQAEGEHHGHDEHHGDGHEEQATPAPPIWTVIPFLALLAAIAAFPLIPSIEHWWEHNSSRFMVAAGLGLVTLLYYAVLHPAAIEVHFPAHAISEPTEGGISWGVAGAVLANAILGEYVPFIMLLFALYCVSGGVRIEGDLTATPRTNTTFITIGGMLASFIGTTGAAMLLIRPLLETNRQRRHVVHTVVFFIFVVCNCGGCLLPIGDPPLFLGYLQGVDFFWTMSLWKEWAFANAVLIAIYWVWDAFFAYPQERSSDVSSDRSTTRPLSIRGLWPNAPLLLGVIAAVALLDPSKTVPGTDWHPWIFLREAVLAAIVAVSLAAGSEKVRHDNGFTYGAILEVAALFVGIFVCMQPALAILDEQGASLGVSSPLAFFWTTGLLSSVLDNAPTYLVFFKTAQTLPGGPEMMAGVEVGRLAGVSLGAVFLGAMTYIGNGPNFMVKAIAEKAGVRMPSFFGYLAYSGGVLVPVFVLVSFLFL